MPPASEPLEDAVAADVLVPGLLAFQRFRLVRVLGRGGMGEVWLAQDESLGQPVALKFIPAQVALEPTALAQLKEEVLAGRRISHPNVVRLHDLVTDPATGRAAISMEYVEGLSLAALKQEQPARCFQAAQVARWLAQICQTLAYVHEKAQMVHRDLKPANFLLTRGGEVKISDFGIARALADSLTQATGPEFSGGTLAYMSPQQLHGKAPRVSDDIYSLGACLYDLLCARPPFFTGDLTYQVLNARPPSMSQRRAELGIQIGPLPAEWEEVVAACLEKDPQLRPPSVRAIARRLSLGGETVGVATSAEPADLPQAAVQPASPPPRPPFWRRWLSWFRPKPPRPPAVAPPTADPESRAYYHELPAPKAQDGEPSPRVAESVRTSLPPKPTAAPDVKLSTERGTARPHPTPSVPEGGKAPPGAAKSATQTYDSLAFGVTVCGFPPNVVQPGTATVAPAGLVEGDRIFEEGRRRLLEGDLLAAREAFARAAELGHAGAREQLDRFNEFLAHSGGASATLSDPGRAHVLFALARDYARGVAVPQDFGRALALYQEAAELGSPDAQVSLGQLYLLGQGVPKMPVVAAALYRQAAEQKHPMAMLHLGALYEKGSGVPADPQMAISWYEKALAAGESLAEERLERLQGSQNAKQAEPAGPRQRRAEAPPRPGPPPPPRPPEPSGEKIFLCYSRRDLATAQQLVQALRAQGFRIWMDLSGIDGARRWREEIVKAIDACEVLLLLLSSQSVKSRWVLREVGYADDQEKPLLPVYLEEVANPLELKMHLTGVQALRFDQGDYEENIRRIAQALRGLNAGPDVKVNGSVPEF